MIQFSVNGNYDKLVKWLKTPHDKRIEDILEKYGQLGVERLAEATPKDTGVTASSWSYMLKEVDGGYSIAWNNSSSNKGIPIVILIQYGHATRNHGYVEGRDFINPVIEAIAEELTSEVDKEVRNAYS